MKYQKKYEETLGSIGFEQNPNNKSLWTKTIEDKMYGANMKGAEPDIFRITEDLQHEADPSDTYIREVLKTLSDAAKSVGNGTSKPKKTPAAPKKPPTPPKKQQEAPPEKEPEQAPANTFKCELCGNAYPLSDSHGLGFPETHQVCSDCNEQAASGGIDVTAWYPETTAQEPVAETAPAVITPAEVPQRAVAVTHSIKGISPQLCECGKIKIGKKGEARPSKGNGTFRLPTKLDHFVVTTTEKNSEGDFLEDKNIMGIIGNDCKAIPVRLLYDEAELNFPTSYAYYDSAACVCRGDGENAKLADGELVSCDPDSCPWFKERKCKPNGVLSVILEDAPRVGGVYKFRTTSWNSIRNLTSAMGFIKGLTGGVLAGLPLVLTVQPKTTLIPGTKSTTVIFMVNIEYKGSIGAMMSYAREEAQQRADMVGVQTQLEAQARLMLDQPESAEECNDVVCEFYPDQMVETKA